MRFLDREEEFEHLKNIRETRQSAFAVIWGRRRIGKTRMLIEWAGTQNGAYFSADQSVPILQRKYFSVSLSSVFPNFSDVEYPDWTSLFNRLGTEAQKTSWRGTVIIDEFPYLVQADPSLPSILQNWIDSELPKTEIMLIISGSSQKMMQGIVLEHSSPLFGRAHEILKLEPIPLNFLPEILQITNPIDVIKAYSHWGGIPRYWELAEPFKNNLQEAVSKTVLSPLSALHDECGRLLAEDNLSNKTLNAILDVVGNGGSRVSEIAGRIGIPVTALTRPLKLLMELGYLKKEIPFGESEKTSKRSLYKIADPFLNFWTKVIAPNKSSLRTIPESSRIMLWKEKVNSIYPEIWEDLCRSAMPAIGHRGPWKQASRYWQGNSAEFDIVCESIDEKHIFIAEVKWSDKPFSEKKIKTIISTLKSKKIPETEAFKGRNYIYGVFVPEKEGAVGDFCDNIKIFTASDIIASC